MGFTHILFLFAGAAIVGPILAHLLNRSKFRKVPFTMLRFLELSQKQTQSKRRINDLIILLLRCLIILFIAALFAGPVVFKQIQRASSRDIHVLLLDNSISMSCEDQFSTCFEQLHEKADEYLQKNQGPESVFHIYSTVAGCVGQDLTAKAAQLLLDDFQIQEGATDLAVFFADLKQMTRKKGKHDTVCIHVISDFTDEFVQSLDNHSDSDLADDFSFHVIAEDLNADNLAVTNAQVLNLQGSRLTLSATVANWGQRTIKRLIRADLNNTSSEEIFVNPIPGQQVDILLTLDVSDDLQEMQLLPVEIKLLPEDNLVADDVYPLGVSIRREEMKDVLLVGNHPEEMFLIHTAMKTLMESANSDIRSIDLKTFSAFNPQLLYAYDLVIASTIDSRLKQYSADFQQYLESGGHCVFFVTGQTHAATSRLLYDQGVLPALPEHAVHQIAHPEPLKLHTLEIDQQKSKMLSVLQRYRVDKIPLWSYYTCRQSPETVGLWQMNPQTSLLYQRRMGNGYCTLINTSIDDAYSGLTKNPAILPLIRFLMGQDEHVSDYSYACDETILVSLDKRGTQKEMDYIDAADQKHTIHLPETASGIVRIPGPHRCGWVRTLTDPVQYIGVHPVANETKLKRMPTEQIDGMLGSLFRGPDVDKTNAQQSVSKEALSLNRHLIACILFLIFLESYIANRMQRS